MKNYIIFYYEKSSNGVCVDKQDIIEAINIRAALNVFYSKNTNDTCVYGAFEHEDIVLQSRF